jgi:hypothetical protein
LDEKIEHKITMLPQAPILFYYNEKNEFTLGLGGLEDVGIEEIDPIEWCLAGDYFIAFVTGDDAFERVPVFYAPVSDIRHLVTKGLPESENILRDMDGYVIDIDIESVYCKQVYRRAVFSSGLEFSNSLVKLSVVVPAGENLVNY